MLARAVIRITLILSVSLCTIFSSGSFAQDKIELQTIQIKGNKELPKILYVVPWQDAKHNKNDDHKIKLHNFFGELYEPLTPAPPPMSFDTK